MCVAPQNCFLRGTRAVPVAVSVLHFDGAVLAIMCAAKVVTELMPDHQVVETIW